MQCRTVDCDGVVLRAWRTNFIKEKRDATLNESMFTLLVFPLKTQTLVPDPSRGGSNLHVQISDQNARQ